MSVKPMTIGDFEAFYQAEYRILVTFLVFFGASVVEAEDAAQKTMTDLYRRLKEGKGAILRPAPWARCAAHRYFVKERQRDRERLPREIEGCHLTAEAYPDDGLTAWEDEQYVEHLLSGLTATEQAVLRLVLAGKSTREIAQVLGKREDNIRQLQKNGRDRLKLHPEIAPLARKLLGSASPSAKSLVNVSEAPEEASQ